MAKKKKKSARSKSSAKSKKSTAPLKKAKTIGILHSGSADQNGDTIQAFMAELGYQGYTVGQNLTVAPNGIPLWSNDDPNLLAKNAATLAATDPDLDLDLDLIIAAGGTASVYAIQEAQNQTGDDTNVVFTSFSQLTRPAANMTGVDARTSDLDQSRLMQLYDLLKKPKQTTFGVLENPSRNDYDPNILQAVAAKLNSSVQRENLEEIIQF
jgi:hypothetical protein